MIDTPRGAVAGGAEHESNPALAIGRERVPLFSLRCGVPLCLCACPAPGTGKDVSGKRRQWRDGGAEPG
jgi:hypothetical protein